MATIIAITTILIAIATTASVTKIIIFNLSVVVSMQFSPFRLANVDIIKLVLAQRPRNFLHTINCDDYR